jgi:adenine-specific DNA-methyltransferase
MRNNIFKYLTDNSPLPNNVDRLIISSFLLKNKITVENNEFIKSFIILESDIREFYMLQEFIEIIDKELGKFELEELIQLFEYVISPSDRIVNGAIYTPLYIREFIINQSFKSRLDKLSISKIADISCGCGGFLLSAAKQLRKDTNKSYFDIFDTQIFGLDIQPYSITRSKLLLSVLALSEGEDREEFNFNLFIGDALTFKWENLVNEFIGFDIILGNPPYVCARNLSDDIKLSLKNWEVCKSGNPDLYIPFFQIGIENLAVDGILGYITMNSFFKSLNGRSLRDYFKSRELKFKIIDFGTEQIFKSKNTYTCICLIESTKQDFIRYYKSENKELPTQEEKFSKIPYIGLNSKTGWNLQDHEIISKIESTGIAFGDIYKTRHGIATLKNDIYIFSPVKEDKNYYYLQNGSLYQIEKGICKDIVNTNKLSREVSLNSLKEKVIFPYDNEAKPKVMNESYIKKHFPKAYHYLQNKRKILDERDKGQGKYENWFAFGRTQSLERVKNKLFFPKMSDRTPSYIINSDDDLLFYNGQAIIGHSEKEMILIKKIMESRLFWYYIKCTSKPYSSNYYSLNGNYIRNFGICELDNDELDFVLNEQDRCVLDTFFERKYDINIII